MGASRGLCARIYEDPFGGTELDGYVLSNGRLSGGSFFDVWGVPPSLGSDLYLYVAYPGSNAVNFPYGFVVDPPTFIG